MLSKNDIINHLCARCKAKDNYLMVIHHKIRGRRPSAAEQGGAQRPGEGKEQSKLSIRVRWLKNVLTFMFGDGTIG